MLGASLQHRGRELLFADSEAWLAGRTTGLPLLHPWANRLSSFRYLDVDLEGLAVVRVGDDGLPRHGTMLGARRWRVVEAELERVVARFDYDSPGLLAAFPFPHRLEYTATLSEDGLRVELAVEPTGDRPVPISFGFHPYLTPPGARAEWQLELPEREHLELDARGIPTGRREREPAGLEPLGDRSFDDLYAGGGRLGLGVVHVQLGSGYGHFQVYAPPGRAFAALEPMTAPTNALVTDCYELAGNRFAADFAISAT
jgi:galactose mutarotase-like enzyme